MTLTKNRGAASKGQTHDLRNPLVSYVGFWPLDVTGVRRLISRQRASKRRHQPNRNQKAAVSLSHNFKFGKILPASTTGSPHRVAPGKLAMSGASFRASNALFAPV